MTTIAWDLPAPSEGTLHAVRRLISAEARDHTDARKLLVRWWPKVDHATLNVILAVWHDATTVRPTVPEEPITLAWVAPIGAGRIVDGRDA